MPTHAEQIFKEPTPGIEPAQRQIHGEYKMRGHRRRRRTPPRQTVTPGRVAKFVVLGVLGLVGLVLIAAAYVRSVRQEDHVNAEQERACADAYNKGDAKLTAIACEPGNWQRPR